MNMLMFRRPLLYYLNSLLLQSAMQFLHAINPQIIQTLHTFAHRFTTGDGGVLRHALGEGGAADAVAVADRLNIAAHGVDHCGNLAVFNRIDNMRATFEHFVHHLHGNALLGQIGCGAAGGAHAVA